nr:MAG TPA: S-adenosylmethionine synthetase domain protein [Caudoviricetes sp.]
MIYEEQLTLSDLHDRLDQKGKEEECEGLTIEGKKQVSLTYQPKRISNEKPTV